MSEAIAEMVLPGTYVEVRSEGLIGVGGIATGVIGVVGTAGRGPVGEPKTVGSYAAAIDLFGAPDSILDPAEADTALSLTRAIGHLFAGGARDIYAVRIASDDPVTATYDVLATGGNIGFRLAADSPGSAGNGISGDIVDAGTDATPRFVLTLETSNRREQFGGGNVTELHDAIADGSRLVVPGELDGANATRNLVAQEFALEGGTSNPDVNVTHVAAGLAALETMPINIVTVAGLGADEIATAVTAHLERTENDAKDRIAVLGAGSPGEANDAGAAIDDAQNDDRVVLCAPGLREIDPSGVPVVLPPAALAAVVAGKIATLAPHISLTNKALPVETDVDYDSAVVKALLGNRFLVVKKKLGYQVVQGLTTDPGAFRQISVRRIVDYAKAGVRKGSDPYIGKLNNARVRGALKATLDGFLSQMVLDEMLTAYELDVNATRAQEINGIAAVTLVLQPTFSIDFVRVTMTLQ